MDDETYIRRSLDLAEKGRGLTSPNPLVGAVLVAASGKVLAEGWHEGPGTPHAEAVAIELAGERARGATLYSSLEPCNHVGRTAACTETIIAAGVSRVVAAIGDPNPSVAGEGAARLRAAGLDVELGVLPELAERQNEAFFMHMRSGRPFVTIKMAATLDGKTAARDGTSSWITSSEAQAEVHRMRGASDAVMVGAGTVVADDPRLTVRLDEYRGTPPLRIVVDAVGRISADGNLFDASAPTLVATTGKAPAARQDAWAAAGGDVLLCDEDAAGGVGLADLLAKLGKRDVRSVLVEGGATLAGRLVDQHLADKVVFFFAPKLLGGTHAPGILGAEGVRTLADAWPVEIAQVSMVGPDVKVEAYVQRDH